MMVFYSHSGSAVAWLVLSAATVVVPRSVEQSSPAVTSDVRATIVFPRADNAGSYSVGVGRRGVFFGGTW